jgi:isopropylmalate/homocitrate/citramalate synthase
VLAHSPRITVVEVGPRDGLQNEPGIVPTAAKVRFIEALAAAGLPVVEATSFVNPKAVPQLADADEVMRAIRRRPGVRYPVLVPNERGLDRALAAGVDAIALFTAATEAFAQANVGTTIAGTFERFAPVMERARVGGLWVRGYVSVVFGCPYSGAVAPPAAIAVAARLFALGCDEVSLADTIGVATPVDVERLLVAAPAELPVDKLALHFHDTGGRAIENVAVGLRHGITIFDAAAGGLGGCPFAPGAPGNLATERLLDFLGREGIDTGVDAAAVAAAVDELRGVLAEPGSPGPSA